MVVRLQEIAATGSGKFKLKKDRRITSPEILDKVLRAEFQQKMLPFSLLLTKMAEPQTQSNEKEPRWISTLKEKV